MTTPADHLRTPRWPFPVIVVLLASMVAVPLWEGGRRGDLLDRMDGEITPARTALLEMERAIASSAADTRGFLLSHDTVFLGRLRGSLTQANRASARLELVTAGLGPEVTAPVQELLRRNAARAGVAVVELERGGVVPEESLGGLDAAQRGLDDALDAAAVVDEVLERAETDTRARIRASEVLEDALVGGMAVAALVVSLFVAWLVHRLSRREDDLRRVGEEREGLLQSEREARAALEAAVHVRDQVLRIVSHDLRNPLHTVTMAIELLEMPIPAEARATQVGIIRRTIGRANRMLLDLLDASRIEEGHAIAVVPIRVEVGVLLDEAVEDHRARAASRNVVLGCEVAAGTPDVLADRDRVLQVLANLVTNALKFTPEGGRVHVDAVPDGAGMVRFSVSDTGPGIPGDVVPHIFEPFMQARETASLGTGLGLSIARGIVEAHGGIISVESRAGEGTAFHFTLPVARTGAGG